MNDANLNPAATGQQHKNRRWIPWLVVILLLAAAGCYGYSHGWLKKSLDWIASLGPWGPIVFIVIYTVSCVLLVPGSALTLGAGALFGVVKGSIYVSIAATLGAGAAFLVGRYIARDAVARRISRYPRFAAMDEAVADHAWKIVFLTRLSPLFPFALLNYAFGLTRVSLKDYITASWIGMLPGTVMYVYLGSLARAAADHGRTPAQWALYAVGLVATIVVTILVTRIARRALNEHLPESQPKGR